MGYSNSTLTGSFYVACNFVFVYLPHLPERKDTRERRAKEREHRGAEPPRARRRHRTPQTESLHTHRTPSQHPAPMSMAEMGLPDLESIPLETLRREVALQDSLHHSLLRNIQLKAAYPSRERSRSPRRREDSPHTSTSTNRKRHRSSHSPSKRRRHSRSHSRDQHSRHAPREKARSPSPKRESKNSRQKNKSSKRKDETPSLRKSKHTLRLNEACTSAPIQNLPSSSRQEKPASSQPRDHCRYLPPSTKAQEVSNCTVSRPPDEPFHQEDVVHLDPLLDRSLEDALLEGSQEAMQDPEVAMLLSPNIIPREELRRQHQDAEALIASSHHQVTDPLIPEGLQRAIHDVIQCHSYSSLDMDGEEGIFHFPPDSHLALAYTAQAQSMVSSATISTKKHPVQPPLLHWIRRTGEPSRLNGQPPIKEVSAAPASLFGLISDRAASKTKSTMLQIPINGAKAIEISTQHALHVNRTQALFQAVVDEEAVKTNINTEALLDITPEVSNSHEALLRIRESTLKLQRAREQIRNLQTTAAEHLVFSHSTLEVARRNKFLSDNPLKGTISKDSKDTLICSTLGSKNLFSEEAIAQTQAQHNIATAAGCLATKTNASSSSNVVPWQAQGREWPPCPPMSHSTCTEPDSMPPPEPTRESGIMASPPDATRHQREAPRTPIRTLPPRPNRPETRDRPTLAAATQSLAATRPQASAVLNVNVFDLPHSSQLEDNSSRSVTNKRAGFSQEVVERIAKPQRKSTLRQYQAKMNRFFRWCNENEVNLGSPTIPQISEFFQMLFHKEKRQPRTIRAYQSVLANHYHHVVVPVKDSIELTRLVQSYFRDRSPANRVAPPWDLGIVLKALKEPPFEPMSTSSLKYLTLKAVFLTALASGRRRSEIHALAHNKVRSARPDGINEILHLGNIPEFIAKNQLLHGNSDSAKSIIIPAIRDYLGPDLQNTKDGTLCPVRAIKHYRKRTKHFRGSKRLLFLSMQRNREPDIAPATISSYIKQTIQFAYAPTGNQPKGVKAHQVRSAASSWAFTGGASLKQLMDACYWRSHTTFSSFYLKDHWTCKTDRDMYSLGPIVAAGSIVHVGHWQGWTGTTSCPSTPIVLYSATK